MKSYQIFLTKAARPIGIMGALAIALYVVIDLGSAILSTTDQEIEFAAACTLQDGYVKEIAKNHWCVKGGPIETDDGFPSSVPMWIKGCQARGGTIRDPSRNYSSDEICVTFEIITELGKLNDFTGGQ